jgi:integrase/recombinase XerD
MSRLAPTLQAFFTDRLITQTDASPRTIAAYRDTFRLLLAFTARRATRRDPLVLPLRGLPAPRTRRDDRSRDRDPVQTL